MDGIERRRLHSRLLSKDPARLRAAPQGATPRPVFGDRNLHPLGSSFHVDPVIKPNPDTTVAQRILSLTLGVFMIVAGAGHLSFARIEFQAQVPPWLPLAANTVVLISGGVEILLGLLMILGSRYKAWVGCALALFFVLVFPGNVSQYVREIDAFGLNTQGARLGRLFVQPLLVLAALWSTGAWGELFKYRDKSKS